MAAAETWWPFSFLAVELKDPLSSQDVSDTILRPSACAGRSACRCGKGAGISKNKFNFKNIGG